MANSETQRNQCQRWFEGKWFVRSLASTKLLHKFPFICCLSVLACGYMWVQTGYFEIKNLGVDNSLETKVKYRLHLGERWSKKDVFYQALGIWSGSSSLFETDAHGSLVLGHHKGIFLIWKITLCPCFDSPSLTERSITPLMNGVHQFIVLLWCMLISLPPGLEYSTTVNAPGQPCCQISFAPVCQKDFPKAFPNHLQEQHMWAHIHGRVHGWYRLSWEVEPSLWCFWSPQYDCGSPTARPGLCQLQARQQ